MRTGNHLLTIFVVVWLVVNFLNIMLFRVYYEPLDRPVGPRYTTHPSDNCPIVDIVYTWVNGSDPRHIAERAKWAKRDSPGRYRDYNVMQFSVRSIEKFAIWARNIFFVTDGQVPSWLDTTNPRVRIVPHEQIFPNKTDLPTYNSNAIEAHLHKIPGVADCFMYMNDDFFLGRETPLDHFVRSDTGALILYMDGFRAPEAERMKTNTWHRTVAKSNKLINSYYYPNRDSITDPVRHSYAGHHCYFMKKKILDVIWQRWKPEFVETSHNKFRKETDTAIPFLHANVALEEFRASTGRSTNFGGVWGKDHSRNVATWNSILSSKPFCACLQDGLDDSPESLKEITYLAEQMCLLFPTPSSFEKPGPEYDLCKKT